MKRRFKHSVFVFAFAALVVGAFLPLVISASKRSAEWFSPRTVLAAPVDARSSGVGSLLAAFRVGAGIHASLALNIPSQQTYPEIQQQLNTSMTGINGVIANNISYSWTSSNPLTNKTILRLIRESHTLRICTSAGHASLPHFAMASSTQIRNLSRRHILIRRRAGSTPSGALPCRGDRSTNQRRGVRSAELRDGFLRVIYTADSPSPPLAPATAT